MNSMGNKTWGWPVGILGYAVVALIYLPVIWLMVMSVSEKPLSGIPSHLTDVWYEKLFSDQRWLVPLGISTALAVGVGLVCMLIATVLGRTLARRREQGRILLFVLLPLFVPATVLGAALFLYFRLLLGFSLGYWSLFVTHCIWAFPFSLLAVLVVASRFDERLLEASRDLGATPWQSFWHVEFPLLKLGIVASGLFAFLLSFNELGRSIFLRGDRTTLPIFEWVQAASHTSNIPLIYSLSTMVLLASLVLVSGAFWMLFARRE